MYSDKKIEITNEENYSILKFGDFVDVTVIEKARPMANETLPEDCCNIIIDLSETSFLDSHGVGFFVSLLKRAHSRKGHLFFVGANNQPASVLKMVGFNDNLVIYCDNVSLALERLDPKNY